MGERFLIFSRAKQYLRSHPGCSDQELADVCGAKLAFAEERDLLAAARREVEADYTGIPKPRQEPPGFLAARFAQPDPDPLYRCNGSPMHAYLSSEAIDGGCPKCWEARQPVRDVTAGQNEDSAAWQFERRIQHDI